MGERNGLWCPAAPLLPESFKDTSFSPQGRISASPYLHSVGIFLDPELRKMKFFDVSDDSLTMQLLYLLTEGNIETPLSICSCLFKVRR